MKSRRSLLKISLVYSVTLFISCAAANPVWAGELESCRDIFAAENSARENMIGLNENVKATGGSYSLHNYRPLNEYLERLGNPFQARFQRANTWLDVGSGYGLAGLTGARKGKSVVTINAQDVWGDLLRSKSEEFPSAGHWFTKNNSTYFQRGDVILVKYDGHRKALISSGGASEGFWNVMITMSANWRQFHGRWTQFRSANSFDQAAEHIHRLSNELLKNYSDEVDSGHLQTKIGYAENVLPTLQRKFDLITDLFGAYFYSATRIELLQHYYNTLSPDGAAFIYINGEQLQDQVILKNGTSMKFWNFLVRQYPDVFQLTIERPTANIMNPNPVGYNAILRITRSDARAELELPLSYGLSDVELHRPSQKNPDMVIPWIRFHER